MFFVKSNDNRGGYLVTSQSSSNGKFLKIEEYNDENELEAEIWMSQEEGKLFAEQFLNFVNDDNNFR